jgi:hypothetical protein
MRGLNGQLALTTQKAPARYGFDPRRAPMRRVCAPARCGDERLTTAEGRS